MNTKDIVTIALFATLLSICSWIYIPMTIPVTMQTFAVFLAMIVLGGKKGMIVIGIYMLLGILGVPVFAGGTAGMGVIFGTTGGYMIGWLLQGFVMWLGEKFIERKRFTGNQKFIQILFLVTGLIICYFFGTWWFINIYTKSNGNADFWPVFSVCVLPFVIPDLMKMFLALHIGKRLKRFIGNV